MYIFHQILLNSWLQKTKRHLKQGFKDQNKVKYCHFWIPSSLLWLVLQLEYMGLYASKNVLWGVQIKKAQTSVHIRTV